jgi:hypothetical protein
LPKHIVDLHEICCEGTPSFQFVDRPGAEVIDRPYSDRQIRKKIYAKYSQYEQSSPLDERDSAIVEVTPERKFSWGIE